jgi:DNA-directed RNA polymerase subunit RPC12/RpoP
MSPMVPFESDCRGCGETVKVYFPETEERKQTNGVRIRCENCGTTNWAEKRTKVEYET